MEDKIWLMGVIAVLLLIPVKALAPKMMDSGNPKLRFGIGLVLFLVYTAVLLLVLVFINAVNAEGIDNSLDRVYFIRYAIGVSITNLAALFTACLYYFTREKRKMSDMEKMKLKDM